MRHARMPSRPPLDRGRSNAGREVPRSVSLRGRRSVCWHRTTRCPGADRASGRWTAEVPPEQKLPPPEHASLARSYLCDRHTLAEVTEAPLTDPSSRADLMGHLAKACASSRVEGGIHCSTSRCHLRFITSHDSIAGRPSATVQARVRGPPAWRRRSSCAGRLVCVGNGAVGRCSYVAWMPTQRQILTNRTAGPRHLSWSSQSSTASPGAAPFEHRRNSTGQPAAAVLRGDAKPGMTAVRRRSVAR